MATLSSIITPTNITTASNTQTLTNKTITGGILNGTLGATTPSTVAATTVSATQTLTISPSTGVQPCNIYMDNYYYANLISNAATSGICGLSLQSKTSGGVQKNSYVQAYAGDLNLLVDSTNRIVMPLAGGVNVTGALSSTGDTTLASSSNKVFMCGSTASVSVERALMQFDGSGSYGFGIKCTSATGSHMRFYNSGGTDNGYIYSTNSTTMVYGSASDGRLKTNIRPLNDSGSIIDAIQPHIFDWKHGETLNCHGFIAQELNEVFPEAVVAGDDDEDVVKSTWGVDPAKLVPVLVAELQSIRKRLAALESK